MNPKFVAKLESARARVKEAAIRLKKSEEWWNEVSLGCMYNSTELKEYRTCKHKDTETINPRCHHSICPRLR